MKLITVIGARPQFIKAAPFSKVFRKGHTEKIVHTGQHYDSNMSDIFFNELDIPRPDYNLEVGSGSHGRMTGRMLEEIEAVLLQEKPDALLVYGDTNSTLAGALAASKLHIPVVHVEAGLRSYDMRMPEEQNRVLTDHISSLLMCPTEIAVRNLKKEGIIKGVHNTGDIMYDAVLHHIARAENRQDFSAYIRSLSPIYGTEARNLARLSAGEYYLTTVHRAENTDDPAKLTTILSALDGLNAPVLFPIHPRTLKQAQALGLRATHVLFVEPVGYLEMLVLTRHARKVLTDSGGLQKEAFFLKTPCITLRDRTEWVETLAGGHNLLSTIDENEISAKAMAPVNDNTAENTLFGNGHAAEKIATLVEKIN